VKYVCVCVCVCVCARARARDQWTVFRRMDIVGTYARDVLLIERG
jgi:hypothetical protein